MLVLSFATFKSIVLEFYNKLLNADSLQKKAIEKYFQRLESTSFVKKNDEKDIFIQAIVFFNLYYHEYLKSLNNGLDFSKHFQSQLKNKHILNPNNILNFIINENASSRELTYFILDYWIAARSYSMEELSHWFSQRERLQLRDPDRLLPNKKSFQSLREDLQCLAIRYPIDAIKKRLSNNSNHSLLIDIINISHSSALVPYAKAALKRLLLCYGVTLTDKARSQQQFIYKYWWDHNVRDPLIFLPLLEEMDEMEIAHFITKAVNDKDITIENFASAIVSCNASKSLIEVFKLYEKKHYSIQQINNFIDVLHTALRKSVSDQLETLIQKTLEITLNYPKLFRGNEILNFLEKMNEPTLKLKLIEDIIVQSVAYQWWDQRSYSFRMNLCMAYVKTIEQIKTSSNHGDSERSWKQFITHLKQDYTFFKPPSRVNKFIKAKPSIPAFQLINEYLSLIDEMGCCYTARTIHTAQCVELEYKLKEKYNISDENILQYLIKNTDEINPLICLINEKIDNALCDKTQADQHKLTF